MSNAQIPEAIGATFRVPIEGLTLDRLCALVHAATNAGIDGSAHVYVSNDPNITDTDPMVEIDKPCVDGDR